MTNPDELQRKILAYKSRICNMILYPNDCDPDILEWYRAQIVELEAELAVDELMCELEAKVTPRKGQTVTTDCYATVIDLCRKTHVVKIEFQWSWRWFKPMFYVEFY